MVWRRGGCVCANKLPWPARDKRPPPRSPLSMWQSREEDREPAHADHVWVDVSVGQGDVCTGLGGGGERTDGEMGR